MGVLMVKVLLVLVNHDLFLLATHKPDNKTPWRSSRMEPIFICSNSHCVLALKIAGVVAEGVIAIIGATSDSLAVCPI